MHRVTITLTRYAEPDGLLREVLAHAAAQTGVAGEVLLIEQKPNSLISEDEFSGSALPLRILRAQPGSLSGARNLAVDEARHDLILFLDADAIAAPDWAAHLAEALDRPGIAVAGSRIVPRWTGRAPRLARARVVHDQFSLFDLGEGQMPCARVVGAAFGINRALTGDLRFDPALGRRDGKLLSGEESDFCQRAGAAGGGIVYQGRAVVEHIIAPDRMRYGWIARRLFYTGLSRGLRGGTPSPSAPPGLADWLSLPLTLPPYALGWLRGRLTRSAP